MAQAEVIREFVVQLGFKTDERSLKKFSDGVENATKQVAGLVTAIAGSATIAALYKFASNMEAVYFSVQKAGASAVNLKAFEKAAQNFGAASGDALQSVQSLARMLRQEPGTEGFLASIGIQTRDANGNLRDTTELMADLGNALKNKPYYLAAQYSSMLGIGEDTLRAMMNGDFARELEKQRALLQDSGYDQASKDAHKLMVELRELQTKIEAVGVTVGLGALEFIDKYNPAIQETINVVSRLVDSLGKGAHYISDFGFRATSSVMMLSRLVSGDKKGAREAAKAMVNGMDESLKAGAAGKASPETSVARTGKPSGFLADPVRFFMGMGWSKEQAAGMVANLQRESRLNPGAVGDSGLAYGLAQWHPDRQANFAKWAGKDIRQSTADEQAAFVNYELTQGAERKAGMLLRAAQSAEFAGQVMSRHYERPKNAADEAALRGAAAVQIAQTTTINVNGSNAAATGQAVAGEQDRVNQRLARNAGGVVK